MITSTSYTPDEDIGLLIDALRKYANNPKQLPKIYLVVTGAGPLKKMFLAKFEEFNKALSNKRV